MFLTPVRLSGGQAARHHNLESVNPRLALEWNPGKNAPVKPMDVTPGSVRKVWWLCPNGHEWEARASKARWTICEEKIKSVT